MDYPKANEVEAVLKAIAVQTGDVSGRPVRVDLLPVRGSSRPFYTVVLLSENRARMCDKLSFVLNRRFSLGTRSFLLKPQEVAKLMSTPLTSDDPSSISPIAHRDPASS